MTALQYISEARKYELSVRQMFNPGGGLYLVLTGRRSDIAHCQDVAIAQGFLTERIHPSKLLVRGFTAYAQRAAPDDGNRQGIMLPVPRGS